LRTEAVVVGRAFDADENWPGPMVREGNRAVTLHGLRGRSSSVWRTGGMRRASAPLGLGWTLPGR